MKNQITKGRIIYAVQPERDIRHGVVCRHFAEFGARESRAVVVVLFSADDKRILPIPLVITNLDPSSVRPNFHSSQIGNSSGFQSN